VGDEVHLRGQMAVSSSSIASLGTIPSGLFPAHPVRVQPSVDINNLGYGANVYRNFAIAIDTSGGMNLATATSGTGTVNLDGLWYSLS
jgi:hypothetical protein